MNGIDGDAETHSLGTVTRVTGLSPEILRAWERRYGAVAPLRTEGGTRRYSDADVARLRLLKSAVDAGHRIGSVARLSDQELIEKVAALRPPVPDRLTPALEAIARVDAAVLERVASAALAELGPSAFAQEFVLPLLQTVGDRWAADEISIAGEHLASSLLRSMLRAAITERSESLDGPIAVFATPQGESHELGTLAAAVVAMSLGVRVTYLGADLPTNDLVSAVALTRARALVLGIAHLRVERARSILAELRARLPDNVEIWIGGARCSELSGDSIHPIPTFETLESRVASLDG